MIRNARHLAKNISKKLEMLKLFDCYVDINVTRKSSNDLLGISDTGEHTQNESFQTKAIIIIRGSDTLRIGEMLNSTPLGNSPDEYLEFIVINDGQNELPETGDLITFNGNDFIAEDILPVFVGNTLILNQYYSKGVK